MVKKLLSALAGVPSFPPPLWLMRQAGRYLPEYRALRAKAPDFVQLCLNPTLAAEVTLDPVRRFGFDAAILFADILLVPHALGQKLWFEEGPRLEPVADAAAIARLVYEPSRLAPVMETVKGVRAALPADVALIGFAGAPWTVATYMIEGRGGTDHEAVRALAWSEPKLFARLTEVLVDATSRYLIAQAEAGAEALQLFDSWAGAVPAPLFERAVIEPTKRIVAAVKARYPAIPLIGFARGAGGWLAAYAARTGVDGVGVDQMTDIASLSLPRHVARQGNLDPVLLAKGGKPMREQVGRLIESTKGMPFIFNLGHGVLPSTPPEHVAELVAAVRGG
ncbi:MAG: uroporphyrinogen decarboxylase [Rhizomicrobium sp.]